MPGRTWCRSDSKSWLVLLIKLEKGASVPASHWYSRTARCKVTECGVAFYLLLTYALKDKGGLLLRFGVLHGSESSAV